MALADTARLIASLELDPRKFTKGLSNAEKALGRTESTAFRTGQHIGVGIKNIGRLGIAAAGSISAISIASLNVAGDFEEQLNTINTIAHKTPAELKAVGDSIRDIAKATGTPLDELTQGYYDLLSAGIKAADAQKVLAASNTLAIGGLASTAETVDLLTTAINTYGVKASAASGIADVFAKAIERGKVTAAELAASFATIGPLAAASGISIKEVSAGFARLTATGIPAAEAATDMRSAIVALTKTTPQLRKLEKQTGKNYAAIASRKGLVVALQQMRKDAEKAGVPLQQLVGRQEAMQFILATTGPNFDEYNADLRAMGKASGTAAAQMAERQKGLNFQLARLKSLVKDAGITIGSELLPRLTPLFDRINKAFADPKTQAAIRDFGDRLAKLFSDQNIATGVDALKGAFQIAKEAAPVLADSLRISGAALKIAVDAFKSLPPDVQKLAVGALAVNKLTGGLVTTLAGGLISAILGSLKSAVVGITAGVVNVNGAVAGPGGAPAAAGKGLGDVVKTAPAAIGLTGAASLTIAAIAPLALTELALAIVRASGKDPETEQIAGHVATGVARGMDASVVPAIRKLPGTFDKPLAQIVADNKARTAPTFTADPRTEANAENRAARQIKATEVFKEQERTANQVTQRQGERIVDSGLKQYQATLDSKRAFTDAERETKRETTRGLTATTAAANKTASNVNTFHQELAAVNRRMSGEITGAVKGGSNRVADRVNAQAAAARAAGERARGGGLAAAEAIRKKNLVTNVNVVNRLNLSIRDTQRKLSFNQSMQIYG